MSYQPCESVHAMITKLLHLLATKFLALRPQNPSAICIASHLEFRFHAGRTPVMGFDHSDFIHANRQRADLPAQRKPVAGFH